MNQLLKILLAATFVFLLSCNQDTGKKESSVKTSPSSGTSNSAGTPAKPSFNSIVGIQFSEVRRAFDNGLSFNEYGFQLEPEWILSFTSDSTVKIYSPTRKRFIHYPMYYSHATVFNFAREWFRIEGVSKDSLVFQLLEVRNKVILKKPSKVYMTFYSDDYIKNVLNSDRETLMRPSRRDSLFVQTRARIANTNPDSAFAARNPVIFKSTSPILQVEKATVKGDVLNRVKKSDEYMHPQYNITINKAYKNFGYYISVIVDEEGQIHFRQFLQAVDDDFIESKTKVVKGIIDVYLKNLMHVTPGNTLGFPHSTIVSLYVSGKV